VEEEESSSRCGAWQAPPEVYDLLMEQESLRCEESARFRISMLRSVLEIEGNLLFEEKIIVSFPIVLLDIF